MVGRGTTRRRARCWCSASRSGKPVADHPALPLGQPPKEQTTCLMLLGPPAVLLSGGGRDG